MLELPALRLVEMRLTAWTVVYLRSKSCTPNTKRTSFTVSRSSAGRIGSWLSLASQM